MATVPSISAFERDTAVAPAGDGVWQADISSAWTVPRGGPNGGYIAAMMLRALAGAVLDPDRAPRSLTLHYLRAPAPGRPAQIHVSVEREGRTLTSLSARMVQDDRTMVLALAAFASDFPAAAEYAAPAPDVGPPPELHVVPAGPGIPEIAQRAAMAPVFGPGVMSGGDEAVVGGWLRLAEPRVADAAAVAFYADAWLPSPFALLKAPTPAPTVDLTIHFRTRLPHPGMTPETPVLARFSSSTASGGFFEEDGAIWAPDGTLLAQSRQLALLLPGA
ncbi:MAG: thioesterase family protein [Conexibacter sp.]|nr:thioesterase family protein [Conexibacter sp.]